MAVADKMTAGKSDSTCGMSHNCWIDPSSIPVLRMNAVHGGMPNRLRLKSNNRTPGANNIQCSAGTSDQSSQNIAGIFKRIG
ncbi:MAG: hypothetical protein ABSE63_13710 [Thermoguttaceae bacterium]